MQMKQNRRRFLLGAGVTTAAAGAGALPMLLTPAPAKAWVMAAAGVAQAGLQLYQMSKGGGGGIGKLLAAQTAMLQAMNAQLRVISDTLNQVYENVVEIKDMLAIMPDAVTQANFRGEIRGAVVWGGQILETVEAYRGNAGRAASIAQYKDQAQDALNRIRQPAGALSLESSLANVPVFCLAWYAEMQLMTQAIDFDPVQMRTVAGGYDRTLARWLGLIRAELSRCDADAQALIAAVNGNARFNGATCYTDIWEDYWQDSYGHDGNLTRTRGKSGAQAHRFGASAEVLGDNARIFTDELARLRTLGAPISAAVQVMTQPVWTHAVSPHRWAGQWYGEGKARTDQIAEMARVRAAACAGPAANPGAFPGDEQKRLVTIDRLRQKAVMHYHFLLAAEEAKRSTEAVLQRLA